MLIALCRFEPAKRVFRMWPRVTEGNPGVMVFLHRKSPEGPSESWGNHDDCDYKRPWLNHQPAHGAWRRIRRKLSMEAGSLGEDSAGPYGDFFHGESAIPGFPLVTLGHTPIHPLHGFKDESGTRYPLQKQAVGSRPKSTLIPDEPQNGRLVLLGEVFARPSLPAEGGKISSTV